jgi:hypothetical protein
MKGPQMVWVPKETSSQEWLREIWRLGYLEDEGFKLKKPNSHLGHLLPKFSIR